MKTFVILLRGVNVGGKSRVSMAELKGHLEEQGYQDVSTYINSGNVLLRSDQDVKELQTAVEKLLAKNFAANGSPIRALALSQDELQAVVDNKPQGFGEQPETYHSDVIFLMDITADEAMTAFNPREGVDTIWPGEGVIYSQRLSAERTKSRLNKVMSSPHYKSMTVRNWNTTTKLLELLRAKEKM